MRAPLEVRAIGVDSLHEFLQSIRVSIGSNWDLRDFYRHAHPGNPYVFGLVEDDRDFDFPEPMPVVGVSRSAKGYCLISVLETMKTYSAEDGLTEEAVVTKLRTCQYHHLFLHRSLKHNSSGRAGRLKVGLSRKQFKITKLLRYKQIGNSTELPAIPEHLQGFVRLCLQRNPSDRPSSAQLLEHPFVKNAAPLERHIPSPVKTVPSIHLRKLFSR